jgi:hypothetical protein
VRVLFANEFGAGNGHFVMLREIRNAMERSFAGKLECRFIVPNTARAVETGLTPHEVFALDAIGHKQFQDGAATGIPRSFADIVQAALCKSEEALVNRLKSWRDCFEEFKPDLAIGDYAPGMCMAFNGRCPVLAIGTGHSLPPPELSHFLPYKKQDPLDLVQSQKLLEKINVALRLCGMRSILSLPKINWADDYVLVTIPIFDPYWDIRKQDYAGVLHPGGSPRPGAGKGSGLAYFGEGREAEKILQGLSLSGIKFDAAIRSITPANLARGVPNNVQLHDKLFSFARDLPERSIFVHAGSLGSAAAAMYAGVPQVGLIATDEAWLTSRATEFAQIGRRVSLYDSDPEKIAKAIGEVAQNQNMRKYAIALSERYKNFRDSDPALTIAKRALDLLKT